MELLLQRVAMDVRAHPGPDSCTAGLPSFVVLTKSTPTLNVPRAELRQVISTSPDPLVIALALTWLSAANDPTDLPLVLSWMEHPAPLDWYTAREPSLADLLDQGCTSVDWSPATLGKVALLAANHIVGVSFTTSGALRAWIRNHPDPRATVEYWLSRPSDAEVLWALDPLLYLRARMRGTEGALLWWPPVLTRPWMHGADEISSALAARWPSVLALALDPPLEWPDADRRRVLLFASFHVDAATIARLDAHDLLERAERAVAGKAHDALGGVAILVARKTGDVRFIGRALEEAHALDLFERWLLAAIGQRSTEAFAAWFVAQSADTRRYVLDGAVLRPNRSWAKRVIEGSDDHALEDVLRPMVRFVEACDRSWQAPTDVSEAVKEMRALARGW